MQPNRAATPWGGVATLVTVTLVIAAVVAVFGTLSLLNQDGGTEDGAMYGHVCVTIDQDDIDDGDFSGDGPARRASDREIVCRSYDSLDHPWLVQRLVDLRGLPVLLAVTGCLVGLLRVVERTRDEGPFSAEAVRGLERLRPWATVLVLLGTIGYWVLGGIANDLVANASWPDSGSFWPTVGTFVGFSAVIRLCEFGRSQKAEAVGHRLPADDTPD